MSPVTIEDVPLVAAQDRVLVGLEVRPLDNGLRASTSTIMRSIVQTEPSVSTAPTQRSPMYFAPRNGPSYIPGGK